MAKPKPPHVMMFGGKMYELGKAETGKVESSPIDLKDFIAQHAPEEEGDDDDAA